MISREAAMAAPLLRAASTATARPCANRAGLDPHRFRAADGKDQMTDAVVARRIIR
jgi:hypothetical protein